MYPWKFPRGTEFHLGKIGHTKSRFPVGNSHLPIVEMICPKIWAQQLPKIERLAIHRLLCPSCITLPVVFSASTVLLQFSLCLCATFFPLAFIPASPSCVTAVVTSAKQEAGNIKVNLYYCIMAPNHLLQLFQRYGTSYWTIWGKGRISISLRNFLVRPTILEKRTARFFYFLLLFPFFLSCLFLVMLNYLCRNWKCK